MIYQGTQKFTRAWARMGPGVATPLPCPITFYHCLLHCHTNKCPSSLSHSYIVLSHSTTVCYIVTPTNAPHHCPTVTLSYHILPLSVTLSHQQMPLITVPQLHCPITFYHCLLHCHTNKCPSSLSHSYLVLSHSTTVCYIVTPTTAPHHCHTVTLSYHILPLSVTLSHQQMPLITVPQLHCPITFYHCLLHCHTNKCPSSLSHSYIVLSHSTTVCYIVTPRNAPHHCHTVTFS